MTSTGQYFAFPTSVRLREENTSRDESETAFIIAYTAEERIIRT